MKSKASSVHLSVCSSVSASVFSSVSVCPCASVCLSVLVLISSFAAVDGCYAEQQLDRGVVAIAQPDGTVYVGWRLLKSDPKEIGCVVWRREGSQKPELLTPKPIAASTNLV
ncbi:hypothetical protein FJY63_11765, partial [Candidatus Sumerlaeota bacterium]|nr:hypothetical protein [Candidatus Sumerlaeota bacterium]